MSDEPFTVDGQPPRQARSNGLPAPAWFSLRDIDPRFAVPVLDALLEANVPAYVAPADRPRGMALEVTVHSTPTDRLWVDTRRRDDAERVLERTLPDLEAGLDDDDWAAIVAMFETGSTAEPTWPASEDVDENAPPPSFDVAAPARAVDEEEHFVPPDPGRGAPLQQAQRWGWLALFGGVALLVAPALLGYDLSDGYAFFAILAIVGGFITLVYKMKDSPTDDSGPDDGAVV